MREQSFHYRIWIAGDLADARRICREYTLEVGLCVTVTPTQFIYTGGAEDGVVIGLLHYPRFPTTREALHEHAHTLAERLKAGLCQHSYMVEGNDITEWVSTR